MPYRNLLFVGEKEWEDIEGKGGIKFLHPQPQSEPTNVNLPVLHPLYCTYGVSGMFHKMLRHPLIEGIR